MNDEKISQRIEWMEKDLSSARRWLESGQALNWVPQELRTTSLWAMEACLMAFGYEGKVLGGWNKILAEFVTLIPSEIRHPLVNCYFDAVMLDSYEGDWENWKMLAVECLKDTEKAILQIKSVIENQLKNKPEG